MRHLREKILFLPQKNFFYPMVLLAFCLLAYGPFLPWLGFYWDDLPWIWYIHLDGPAGALGIDSIHRPLAGEFLWFGAWIVRESALGWQIFNLVLRWLGGVCFWWLLQQIWPEKKELAQLGALLFVLYPGFSQQFISVNSSRHIFPLITLFTSFSLTGIAIRSNKNSARYSLSAWVLSLVTMLTTEYYYGLEFVRGIIIWLLLENEPDRLKRIRQSLLKWFPYLSLQLILFYWRYTISFETNYRVILPPFSEAPWDSFSAIAQTVLEDIYVTTILAWQNLFAIPDPTHFGARKTVYYWIVVLAAILLAWIALHGSVRENTHKVRNLLAPLLLGVLALPVSGLLFGVTKLNVTNTFPEDRLSLPFMMGASLVAASILASIPFRGWRLLTSAVLIGLSVGVQFQYGASYREEWEKQSDFFHQLSWRIPGLLPNTALISLELPIQYASDNSLTAPLNWIYAPDYDSKSSLPYMFLNIQLRTGTKLPALEKGLPIEIYSYRDAFLGSTDRMLLIQYSPPGCVRVLDPQIDRHLPNTSGLLDEALSLSNLSLILPEHPAAGISKELYGPPQTGSWCYFFEKADLARQIKHWDEVVRLGDIAFELSDSPNNATERLPFIEGYAQTGNWERSFELTKEMFQIDKATDQLLCDTWRRIIIETDQTAQKETVLNQVEELLDCGFAGE